MSFPIIQRVPQKSKLLFPICNLIILQAWEWASQRNPETCDHYIIFTIFLLKMWKLCIICNYFRISYVLKNPEIQKTLMPDSGYGLCHCETMLHNFCLVHWAHTHNDLCNWSRINLCMCPANESRRYNVTSFLIDWAHSRIHKMIPVWCTELHVPVLWIPVWYCVSATEYTAVAAAAGAAAEGA